MGGASPRSGATAALPALDVAGVGDRDHEREPPVVLLRHEGERRRGDEVRDGRQLVRGRVGDRDEPPQDLRGERQHEHAAEDRAHLVQPEAEARHDAEVAAAAPERPEQVAVLLAVHVQRVSPGGDELDREQVVDREPVLADEPADSPAQREPGDADRPGVAEAGRQSVARGLGGVLPGGEAGLRPRGPLGRVDVQPAHGPEVEHEPAVGDAVARVAVAAAPDRQLQVVLAGERDGHRDVGGAGGTDDERGAAIERRVLQAPGRLVLGAGRGDHGPVEGGPEIGERTGATTRREMDA